MHEVGHLADSILTGYLARLRDVGWGGDALSDKQIDHCAMIMMLCQG